LRIVAAIGSVPSARGLRVREQSLLLHGDVPEKPLAELGVDLGVDGAVAAVGLG
jgi:hypothetical protein